MTVPTDPVLVTGATGRQGGAALRHLLAGGVRVRALTRDPTKASARALAAHGAEVVHGDLDDRASLQAAVAGCHGVFSVQDYWTKGTGYAGEVRQGRLLAELAKDAGVRHFVHASVSCDPGGEAGAPEHFRSKYAVEERVRELGLGFTFLRTVFFLDNLADPKTGHLAIPVLRGILPDDLPLHVVAVDDLGRVARRAFEEPERYLGRTIDVATAIVPVGDLRGIYERATGKRAPGWRMPAFATRLLNGEFAAQLRWNRAGGWRFGMDEVREHLPTPSDPEAYLRGLIAAQRATTPA
jgi:uncharacterized protein YbjT (DUF2867 family)